MELIELEEVARSVDRLLRYAWQEARDAGIIASTVRLSPELYGILNQSGFSRAQDLYGARIVVDSTASTPRFE